MVDNLYVRPGRQGRNTDQYAEAVDSQVWRAFDRLSGYIGAPEITVGVPADFPTLQDAIDTLSAKRMQQGAQILLVIESGHTLAQGVLVTNGDYGHFQISSEDAAVSVDGSFSGHLFEARNARMPVLACLIDMGGSGDRGYYLQDSSIGVVLEGCGVEGAGQRGLYLNQNSSVAAHGAIFRKSGDRNVWVTRASTAALEEADLTDAGNRAVYASRSSRIHMNTADISGAGEIAVMAVRSRISCDGCIINGCGGDGIRASGNSQVTAASAVVTNAGDRGARALDASSLNLRNASVTGSSEEDLRVEHGGVINAHDVTTTNGSPSLDDANVAAFNAIFSAGIIYA